MAFRKEEDTNTTNQSAQGGMNPSAVGIEIPNQDFGRLNDKPNAMLSLGFGTGSLMTMTSSLGTEYVTKMSEAIRKIYENKLPEKERPFVKMFDNKNLTRLAYSCIVIALKSDTKLNYFTVLLEATGNASRTASDVVTSAYASAKSGGNGKIYTTDDAIDRVLHDIIGESLIAEFGKVALVSMDGMVVPSTQTDPEHIALNVATIAYNNCLANKAFDNETTADINIAAAREQSPKAILKLETNLNLDTVKNEVEMPVRADFVSELVVVEQEKQMTSLNLQTPRTTLTRVTGFVDALADIYVPVPNAIPQVRIHPHIIITSASVHSPTPGYALLALLSARPMAGREMFLGTLAPKDNKKGIRNIGALNMITNTEGNPNSIGSVLDMFDKNFTLDQKYTILRDMYCLDPIISMDIESFGPQTSYLSMLSTAAQPGNSNAKINASRQIIKAANWLTNGAFPADFPIDEIFAYPGIVVPLGMWADSKGERDLRDVDAALIATMTQDPNEVYRWIKSNTPEDPNPYLTKLEIIAKVIPSAVTTGKAIRVTFSAKFINTLSEASKYARLDVSYEPIVELVEGNGLEYMNSYISGAGLTGSAGFARQNIAGGPSVYGASWSHMGQNRY